MNKIILLILLMAAISLTGCGNKKSDKKTTEPVGTEEKLVRNQLFNNLESVDRISYSGCGPDVHNVEESGSIEKIMDFLKRLELKEAENPESDGTSVIDLYENQQKVMEIGYSREYFCIAGKWYVTEDSGAGEALDSICTGLGNDL